MNALAKLLQDVNDVQPMSLRRRAAKVGNRISYATIGDYQNGRGAANPDEATLQALAEAYELQLEDVQRAASVHVGAGPWEAPAAVARLTARQQAAITELILAIAERAEGGQGVPANAAKKSGGLTGGVEDDPLGGPNG